MTEGAQRLVLDKGHLTIARRNQRMVHQLDVQTLQIGDVTRKMESQNLTRAVFKNFLSVHIAPDQKAASFADDAVGNDFSAAALHFDPPGQGGKGPKIVFPNLPYAH